MTYFLVNGLVLGLYAGVSPGPLLTLVIAESLRGGWPAGFRIALAPLITDTVIITVCWLLMAPLPAWGSALISAVGGGVMVWMGWGTIRSGAPKTGVEEAAATAEPVAGRQVVWKGILTNLFNPPAYIFWLTVGVAYLKQGWAQFGLMGPVLFMAPFFLCLIGSELVIVFGISRSRKFLQGPAYRWTLGAAGAVLVVLGLLRVWAGIQML